MEDRKNTTTLYRRAASPVDSAIKRFGNVKEGTVRKLKTIALVIFDFIEIYFPMVSFVVVFVSFTVMIVYRYVFFASIQWMNEISIFAYSWCCILAASYGSRSGKHVVFSIVYDELSERKKLICRLSGNLFVLITFCLLLPYAYDFITFMAIKKSPVLKLPFSAAYSPFLAFVVLTLIHHAVLVVKDIRLAQKMWKGAKS